MFLGSIVQAQQGFSLGMKFGANFSKIKGLELTEGYKPGFHFGGYIDIGKKALGVQTELLFSQSGTKIQEDTASSFQSGERVKLSYLQIPILLRYKIGKMFTLHAGPQFGILMNKDETVLENGEQAFKSGDFAMCFGGQFNFGNLRVYGRYNIGLNDISDIDDQDSWQNEVLQLGLAFRIF